MVRQTGPKKYRPFEHSILIVKLMNNLTTERQISTQSAIPEPLEKVCKHFNRAVLTSYRAHTTE